MVSTRFGSAAPGTMTSAPLLAFFAASALIATASASGGIPRIIIQTGPKDTQMRDAKWGKYSSSLRDANPNFEYMYFDDDAALAFVDEHFAGTDLPRVYRDAPKFVLKADLFRYAAVKVLGGFYMDMDMLAKASFEPLVESDYGAAFPREWWRSDAAYRKIYGSQRSCPDAEEHWQVGNYAFAAAPDHPFVVDALNEAMVRTVHLLERKPSPDDITDNDILLSTGPYMLSELYHEGRRIGKYGDVAHIAGDDEPPTRARSYGGDDWHKFGPYAEHMLSHSWVTATPTRRMLQSATDDMYMGDELLFCILGCFGIDDLYNLYDLYDLNGNLEDLYGLLSDPYDGVGQCLIGCIFGEYIPDYNEYPGNDYPDDNEYMGATSAPSSAYPTIFGFSVDTPTPAPVSGMNATAMPTSSGFTTDDAVPSPTMAPVVGGNSFASSMPTDPNSIPGINRGASSAPSSPRTARPLFLSSMGGAAAFAVVLAYAISSWL